MSVIPGADCFILTIFQLKGIEIVNVEWDNMTVPRVVDYEFDIDGYLVGNSKQYRRQITLAGS